MSALPNQRHERFCLALAEGHSIAESYALAGYSKNTGNASRLNANESIQRRIAELKAETAVNAKITIESICQELADATNVARERGEAQAMVSASALRAKLAGLMVERVEVGSPGSFEGLDSTAAIVDKVLADLVEKFLPIDSADREALIAMYERHLQEAGEAIAAIKARPITGERADLRNLSKPWQSYPAYSPFPAKRITHKGNGTKPA